MRILSASIAAFVTSSCVAQTFVGPLPYVSSADSPFDTAHPTYVLETFEDDLFNINGVTANLPNSAVIGPGGLTDSVDADDGLIDGNGTNGHSFFNASGSTGVTFTFDPGILGGLPTHAGVVWTDGAGTTLFEAFGPGDVPLGSIGPVAIADGSFFGTTAEDRFFGVIHAGGIAKIRISNTSGGIEVDHFQFSFESACVVSPDLNGDGHVNATDLAILLGAWGACGAGCCAADLTQNGVVDAADLGIFLGAWTG
ncbi:MAG: hypothetical protein U0572_07760 [Phycisphaerales bacterium]